MIAMPPIDFISIAKWLVDTLRGVRSHKRDDAESYRQRVYRDFVEESFARLRVVHDDYTQNLSMLARQLERKVLPPPELVEWLRAAGLRHRHDREALTTYDAELRGIDFGKLARGIEESQPELAQRLEAYVTSILNYFEVCAGTTGSSFYRDFEQSLRGMTAAAVRHPDRGNDIQLSTFYEADYVKDMVAVLREIVDVGLPKSMGAVRRRYGELRAALGFPITEKGP